MSQWRAEKVGSRFRWLVVGGSVALAPKCLLCLAAYAGAGAALGLGGREICGAPSDAIGASVFWSLLLPGALFSLVSGWSALPLTRRFGSHRRNGKPFRYAKKRVEGNAPHPLNRRIESSTIRS